MHASDSPSTSALARVLKLGVNRHLPQGHTSFSGRAVPNPEDGDDGIGGGASTTFAGEISYESCWNTCHQLLGNGTNIKARLPPHFRSGRQPSVRLHAGHVADIIGLLPPDSETQMLHLAARQAT